MLDPCAIVWLPPNPVRRSFTYVEYPTLLISPSLTTSTPTSTCFATMPLTAPSTSTSSWCASTGSPDSLANMSSTRLLGRGRLPVCVVRIRFVLRCMAATPFYAAILPRPYLVDLLAPPRPPPSNRASHTTSDYCHVPRLWP